MQIEIHAVYEGSAYIEFKTNNPDRLKNAVAEVEDGYIRTERTNRIHKVLREVFDGHTDFYDYADFDAGTAHGANGSTFDTNGFAQFIEDYFGIETAYVDYIQDEDTLQQLADIIGSKIADILQEYEENMGEDTYSAKSMVTLNASDSSGLNDPETIKDSLIVTEDGVYKLKTQKIQGATSMDEIEDKLKEGMKSVYENQVEARVNSMKNRVETLEQRLEDEKQEMLVEGLQMVGEMENWEIQGEYLVYQDRVHPEWVQKKYEDGNPVKLTEEAQEKFYIEGLKIRITQNPSNLYFEDAYHPHALSGSRTCTGSFNYPLREAIERAVEQVKHVDLHTRGHCDAERELKDNFEEYTVGGDSESDSEDVDDEQETLTDDDDSENPEQQEAEVFEA